MQTEEKGFAQAGKFWHVNRQGTSFGPYEEKELLKFIQEGNILADDLVWNPSTEGWRAIKDVPYFSQALPKVPLVAGKGSPKAAKGSWFSRFLKMFLMVLNPGMLLKSHLKQYSWQWALSVSGVAFMLFFLQTSLDLYRVGESGGAYVVVMAIIGVFFGTLGIALFAYISWQVVKNYGNQQPVDWAVKAFGLGYAPALVYTTFGLFANVFLGWNTSLTFGLPGVLWAIRPMMASLKEMTGGKKLLSLGMSVAFGFILFLGWSFLL